MKKTTLQSIGAVSAGFAIWVILSMLMDFILVKMGVLTTEPFIENPVWLILLVILYRTIFNIMGSFVTAGRAPNNPMKHAMILGTIGLVMTLGGLITMWEIPPRWYPVSLMALTMPAAWLGAKLAIKK